MQEIAQASACHPTLQYPRPTFLMVSAARSSQLVGATPMSWHGNWLPNYAQRAGRQPPGTGAHYLACPGLVGAVLGEQAAAP